MGQRYTVLSIVWGTGALISPMMGKTAMELNTHGLPLMATLFCGLFMLFRLKNARWGC
ncbi:major facilitator superfamily protein [Serratia sp. FS14]|nr:major facilitator superfamily protein [Serratia sp. FS14]